MSDKKYKGRIIKGVGGFYYVDTAEYASEGGENAVFECPARGRFRKYKQTPLVGDIVTVIADNLSKKGVVDEILPRRNVLSQTARGKRNTNGGRDCGGESAPESVFDRQDACRRTGGKD